jgi:hypothetical protein
MKAFEILGKMATHQSLKFDRRLQMRVPARYYAYLHAATGAVLSECLVKDISETGARIILPMAVNLPKQIMLRITGEVTPMSASVVWQMGTKCGLEFDDASFA